MLKWISVISSFFFPSFLLSNSCLSTFNLRLQKFKMTIANTVISQDNSTLQSMGTDQLLELFILGEDSTNNKDKEARESSSKQQSIHSILDSLGELWDEKQYESEYNLNSFLESLGTWGQAGFFFFFFFFFSDVNFLYFLQNIYEKIFFFIY